MSIDLRDMLIDLTVEEVKGILTYMYYGIDKCGEIGNTEQNAYTKLYNHLFNHDATDGIEEPSELDCFNYELEPEEEE